MNFSFMPSLKHTTIVATLTLLIKHDLRALIIECIDNDNSFSEVQKKLDEKITKLLIPKNLKFEILKHAEHMLRKFTSWMKWGETRCPEIAPEIFFNSIHLTPIGTINEKKCVEVILENESIDLKIRYYLACSTCLEGYVNKLWSELVDQGVNVAEIDESRNQAVIICYWTMQMLISMTTDEQRKRVRYETKTDKEFFQMAIRVTNSLAARYFWNRLSYSDKISVLTQNDFPWDRDWCSPANYKEYLFLSLPDVSNDLQETLLNSAAFHILDAFLEWPWCIFLGNAAENLCSYLSVDNYFTLVENFQSCDGILYHHILEEFWCKSPLSCRLSLFNDREKFIDIVYEFLHQNNIEAAKVLLDNLNLSGQEQEQFVFSFDYQIMTNGYHSGDRNDVDKNEMTLKAVVAFAFEYIPSRERQVQWIHEVVRIYDVTTCFGIRGILLSHI